METSQETLPSPEEARTKYHLACAPVTASVRAALQRIAPAPPPVLLLEGGTADMRLSMALYWAAQLNCHNKQEGAPCLKCNPCLQIAAGIYSDLLIFDGRLESIKIDAIRNLRATLGEAPRRQGYRNIIFCEAQALTEQSANLLLKSLEEPQPGNTFVLTVAQRERLIPTLISRSWVLTLPWPQINSLEYAPEFQTELQQWEQALILFIENAGSPLPQQSLLAKTGTRGTITPSLAQQLILLCQKALLTALKADAQGGLALCLQQYYPPKHLRILDEALAECQDSLQYTVNPTLVVEWLFTKMHLWKQQAQKDSR